MFDSQAWAYFIYLRIAKPEQFAFQDVLLHPGWLLGTDVRKVDFTDVKWYGMSGELNGTIDAEIHSLKERGFERPYTLLAQACRRLSANAEDNREYPLANEFHYWSMDVLRKENWRGVVPWKLSWWYWLLSGYSERPLRAALWIVIIQFGFAGLYMWQGPVGVQESSLAGALQASVESIVYSLGVMTRLAIDIPKSASALVTSLIIIEGVLGPLQIGLFLLALRREFMR